MTDEHRLTFELYEGSDLEIRALKSIMEKIAVSKRSHEYVRRVMVQGFIFGHMVESLECNIAEVNNAIDTDVSLLTSQEFKFRLNIESNADPRKLTHEEEIWSFISELKRRDERKMYLRKLFISGFWFESIPDRNVESLKQIFPTTINQTSSIPEIVVKPPKNTAKSKLGGLMPLC